MIYNIKDFGAKADGITKATEAIRSAFAKCKEDGGGGESCKNNNTGIVLYCYVI
ncbi:MAG: hypothetical protein LUH47_00830 [Clostridiales bacterium]|nr:hypothetical protein [Clostridiales bacterium]